MFDSFFYFIHSPNYFSLINVNRPRNPQDSALSKERESMMENFEEVANQYNRMIYHIIHRLHLYKNIDEYYQIGLIGLWEAHKRYIPGKASFTTYAYSFIRGRILSELTKMNRHDERYVCQVNAFFETAHDFSLKQPLELEMLLAYCGSLTRKEKMWVIYTFYHDLDIKEIAQLEKVSISAVKKWRKTAIEKIKMRFKE